MIPARMNAKTQFLCRKRSRESANAAMLAVTTAPAATAADVMKLDRYHFQMSPEASVVRNDSRVGFWMNQVGGALVVSAFGLSAESIAQAIGTSQSREKAMRTPKQTRLNSLFRRSYAA